MSKLNKAITQLESELAKLGDFEQRIKDKPADQRTLWDKAWLDYSSEDFEANLNVARDRRKDSIGLKQVAKPLGLTVKTVRELPITNRGMWVKSGNGRRLITCYWKSEVVAYLASLNPSYADFDFEEPLLKPEDVVEVHRECGGDISTRTLRGMRREGGGPDYIQISSCAARYRLPDVLDWIKNPSEKPRSIAEMIMEDANHGN